MTATKRFTAKYDPHMMKITKNMAEEYELPGCGCMLNSVTA